MLAHLFQLFGKVLYQLLFDAESDGQVGVLVRRVDGSAHKEVNIGGVLKKLSGNAAGAIHAGQLFRGQTGSIQKIPGIGQYL